MGSGFIEQDIFRVSLRSEKNEKYYFFEENIFDMFEQAHIFEKNVFSFFRAAKTPEICLVR